MNEIYLSDIPRLYTAIAEWCACLVYICRQRPLRLTGARLWTVLGGGLVLQCLFLQLTDGLYLALWLPCMAGAVGLMFVLISLCCCIPLSGAGYATAFAFMSAEFAASLEWQLYSYTRYILGFQAGTRSARLLSLAFLAAVYAAVFLALLWLTGRRKDPPGSIFLQKGELWTPAVISVSCFLLSNLSFVHSGIPFTSGELTQIYNLRTLVDLAGLAILYAYHVQRSELYMQRELDAIQNVLQNQYAQYRQSRESIDVINRKYHDLKHQIAVLRAETDPGRRSAYLDGMEQEIRDYEAQNKTGNSVLDTVLTGKSLYCARHGVELTCIADGGSLGFMDVMDICTIFGNILDNAIECELDILEKEKRLVRLAVYRKNDFLVIQCGNYCPSAPQFRDGLPVSTKGDAAYHGYGIKSVRHAAEKYGGSVTVHTRDGWFEITVMIPLRKISGTEP